MYIYIHVLDTKRDEKAKRCGEMVIRWNKNISNFKSLLNYINDKLANFLHNCK